MKQEEQFMPMISDHGSPAALSGSEILRQENLHLNTVGTVYDSVFRTECEHLKPLLIPVINELFRTDYAMEDVGALRLANEHLLRDHDTDKEKIKRITDGLIKLGDMMYHIECQSTSDGSILIRLVDYNLRIGYEYASHDTKKGCVRIEFPRSALLILDKGGRTKVSDMQVEYCHGEESLKINIPVMHVQAYSMDEIFEKKLYFLIPFYTMRFKRKIKQIVRDRENTLESKAKYDKIISEMKVFADRLYKACEDKELSEDYTRELGNMYREIAEAMAAGLDDDRREGMVNTMGGKILKLQAEIWMEEGMEKEKVNTEREKKRADEAEQRADEAEQRADEEKKRAVEAERKLKMERKELAEARKEIERLKAAAN